MPSMPYINYPDDEIERDADILADKHRDPCADLAELWKVTARRAAREVVGRVIDCVDRHGGSIRAMAITPYNLADHALGCDLDSFDCGLSRLKNNATRGRGQMPHAESMEIPAYSEDPDLLKHVAKMVACRTAIADGHRHPVRAAIAYVEANGFAGFRRRELLAAAGIKDTCMLRDAEAAARLMSAWRASKASVVDSGALKGVAATGVVPTTTAS